MLLAALSFFAGLGRGAITDSDEAFYAEAAREMVESGDWLTPHYNYEPRFQKPALYYWVTAAIYLVVGPSELAARLWSALAALGLVLVTAACGRRWFDEDIGLLAGAITATNFGYFALARMALPDLPLTFFITLSIYAALVATLDRERHPRRWLLIAAAAAALGFLTKGPVAVILPVLVVVPVLLIERRSLNVTAGDVVMALIVFLAIAIPWYAAMWIRHGNAYVEGFFVGDNYERFVTDRFNDRRPWWFYFPVLAGGLLPWTPLAVVWLAPLLHFLTLRRDVGTLDLRLLLWAVLPLVFYAVSVGQQPRYVLPVLPPVALLLAGSVVERTRDWRSLDGARVRPRPSRAVVLGCALSGLLLVGLAFLLYRARSLFAGVDETTTIAVMAVIAASGVLVAIVSLTSAWRAGPILLAVAGAITFAVLPYGVLAASGDAAVQQMARMVKDANPERRPVSTYHVFVRNLVFYTGIKQIDLINDEHLTRFVSDNPGALIVLPLEDLERLERERGLRLERLEQVRYFDEGAIRVRTLIEPNPSQDLKTAMLVRVAAP